MAFFADLHIHSKFSRATSKHSDLEHAAKTAREKGITVVGTGDFTHPAWLDELKEKLEPAEPGLFRLKDEYADAVPTAPGSVQNDTVRFMLQVEISTIYKKDGKTRKIHHLVFAPDFQKADNIVEELSQIGNLEADGRPILGLDSEDLLEITLGAGEGCHLIPAHVWTPWFSLIGSKSGFDSLEHCYGSLSDHIFALETGLSSDPPMNWRLSDLDDYTLVSNSDAHSPRKMGREACYFDTELNYFDMFESLRTGEDYLGTVEFYPEEGKYYLDGHRKCGVRLEPAQTRNLGGVCPECGDDLTVGVLHCVHDLADREIDAPPETASPFRSLIPLPEILSEIEDVGPNTKTVNRLHEKVTSEIGSDFYVLQQAPIDQIKEFGRPMLTEAVRRLREGKVIKEAGYDGEYGTIKLFTEDELLQGNSAGLLFDDLPKTDSESEPSNTAEPQNQPEKFEMNDTIPKGSTNSENHGEKDQTILGMLDPDQQRAAETTDGPLMIVAGPGTGKTRTLTHRLANLVDGGADPEACLAITFTRRAAREMTERLEALLPEERTLPTVQTFHGFGYSTLNEFHDKVGLPEEFQVATERECLDVIEDCLNCSRSEAKEYWNSVTNASEPSDHPKGHTEFSLTDELTKRGLIHFDGLIELTLSLLHDCENVKESLRDRYRWISVDEYQDVSPRQYELIQQLAPEGSNLCVIGDPDQAIYGFRGSSVEYFQRFEDDYPSAERVTLTRNYRSDASILEAASAVVEPESLVPDRELEPQRDHGTNIQLHEAPTPEAEAEFVVKSIERAIGGTTFFSFDSSRVASSDGNPLSFSDVGVLYRTKQQADKLQEAFSRSGIPFQEHSHQPLSEHPIVSSLLDTIESTPTDFDLPERLETAKNEWLDNNEKTQGFTRLYQALNRRIAEENLETAEALRSEAALGLDVDLWDPRAQGVNLLTLHASKGLEFRLVFMVGCEEVLIPHYWDSDERENNFPEERRLMFVGMTRAEDQLVLSYSQKRTRYGEICERSPSRYLEESNQELIEKSTADFTRTDESQPEENQERQLELI
jgi:uncharacterized protein (TIGR00375 family)